MNLLLEFDKKLKKNLCKLAAFEVMGRLYQAR